MLAPFLIAVTVMAPAKEVHASLPDVRGAVVTVPVPNTKATLLVFVGVDCPIANRMAPEISRIAKDYHPRGVETVLVYPDGSLNPKDVEAHLKAYSLSAAAIIDRKLSLVKAAGATVTPQAVVVDPKGAVRYSGRINDLYEEHGKIKVKPKRNDLRVALDELLAGKPVSTPTTQVVGCFIQAG